MPRKFWLTMGTAALIGALVIPLTVQATTGSRYWALGAMFGALVLVISPVYYRLGIKPDIAHERREEQARTQEREDLRQLADNQTAELWRDNDPPMHCSQITDAYQRPVPLEILYSRSPWSDSSADPYGIDTADVWRDHTSS